MRVALTTLVIAATGLALGGHAGAQAVSGAGATFPYPIYSRWFQAYQKANPGVTFNYQSVGSGAGIAQYRAGTVDFGATDAPLSDKEAAEMPQPTLHIPTVAGAIAVVYNVPGVGPGLKMSGDLIADIYLGKITNWSDARIAQQNPGVRLPSLPVMVAHRSDGSGTTFIFTQYLAAVSRDWRSRVSFGKSVNWPVGIGANGNPGVAGLVRMSRGSLGYVELAYAIQNKLSFATVRNRSGAYVEPSLVGATAAANAGAAAMKKDVRVSIVDGPGAPTYPITGFTYLLVPRQPKDAAKGRALLGFLRWAMKDGQDMAPALEYAPLPASVVALNERMLASVRAR